MTTQRDLDRDFRIYLDEQARDIIVPFAGMAPVGATVTRRFDPKQIDTVLFVVDTTNTQPGSDGSFTLTDVKVEE